MTKAGYAGHFLNACGYTMGATYPPTWMDWPMVFAGEPQVLAPNMVFFLHMVLLNSDTGLSMSLGETAIVTETGCELVSHAPRRLLVAGGGPGNKAKAQPAARRRRCPWRWRSTPSATRISVVTAMRNALTA